MYVLHFRLCCSIIRLYKLPMITMPIQVKHGFSAKTRLYFFLLFLFGSLLLSGCGSSTSAETKAPAAAPPPATVIVEAAKFKDVTEERTFTGRVEAVDTVQIRARVQGYLKRNHLLKVVKSKKGRYCLK